MEPIVGIIIIDRRTPRARGIRKLSSLRGEGQASQLPRPCSESSIGSLTRAEGTRRGRRSRTRAASRA